MTHDDRSQPKPAPPEVRHVVRVSLTVREITALVGRPDRAERPVAVVVTSADNADHRVNYAESALKAFVEAVQSQRP